MNFLDIIIIVLIALYVLNGVYRGFIPSLLNLGGFFVSWIGAFIGYPLLSGQLVQSDLFSSLRFYMEGAEKIGDVELARMNISMISDTQLHTIVDQAKLPTPFGNAIIDNVTNKAFADSGITTLGDYFDTTIFNVIINIISILIIFIILRVILTLVTNAFSYAYQTPQLVHMDYPIGGAVGLVRGFFSMYMLFAVIPIALILFMNVSFVTEIINGSVCCSIFYSNSILLHFVSGAI